MKLLMNFILWGLYLLSLWPVLLLLGMKPQFIGWSILLLQISFILVVKFQILGLTWSLNKAVIALLFINILIAITEVALVANSINQHAENIKSNNPTLNDKE